MHRTTARILLLVGVLLEGVHQVRAQSPLKEQLPVRRNVENKVPDLAASKDSLDFARDLDRRVKPSRKIPSRSLSGSKLLTENLLDLAAPSNLLLPEHSPEVAIEQLRPITLHDVELLLEANNSTLKALSLEVDQAKFLLKAAISAWYPNINLTANGLPEYFESETYRNPDFTNTPFSNTREWSARVSVNVEWDLIDPARVPDIAAARDTFEKAKIRYYITLRDLKLEAISEYFSMQLADEGVRIGKESVRSSLVSLRDARARYKAGVATKIAVLEAETQYARDSQLLTSKLGEQNITRRTLSSLLNLPHGISPTAASPSEVIGIWKPSLEESIVAAYSFRDELDSLILDISIHNSNANKALAAAQPRLTLFNTFSASRSHGQKAISSISDIDMDDYSWTAGNTVGLKTSWRIFDAGKARSIYKYHKLKAKQVKEEFAYQRQNIRKDVEESFYNLNTANQDIVSTSREVIASRESLRLARLRFQAGVSTQREVVNHQRDLTQAEVRYATAKTSYNKSLAQLRRRTGLDEIQKCEPLELPSSKLEDDEIANVPIEPVPIRLACQASKLDTKE